jgi:uncharacterized protein (DUF58 family)
MRRAFWLVLALAILVILALVTGFQPLYWLVYLVVGSAVIAYLWTWMQSRGLSIEVQEISLHPQVRQTIHVKVTVREKLGLPRLGLSARLVGDFTAMEEEDFSLAPRGTSSWTVSGVCHRRGLNTIGSLAMVSGDSTGLLRLEYRVGQPQDIVVYPATIELSRTLVQGQATGGEIAETGQLVGHSPTAFMVRQYMPGDSLTRIHWPTTARMNQLMTKEFEGAGINEVWLFVDLQEAVQAGAGEDSTEEYMVTIAASLAKGLIQDGHAVGLISHGDGFSRFAPAKDSNHLWVLLRDLALARARGRIPLSTILSQESGNMGAGTVAVVIAPWPGQGLGTLFQFLLRRGILVVPIFLDASSFGRLPDSRWLSDARSELQEWAFLIRQGDDLSRSLRGVLDRLASY